MRHTEIDARIERIAARQFGSFSRQQAFEAGASERFVQRRLSDGHWARPVPGVYVLRSSAGSWRRQCKVAELSVSGSAIAGRSAAVLHSFEGFRPGRVELLVPVNASCRHGFAVTHRYAGAALTSVDGIQVTTISQTLFDLAARVDPWRLERALDDVLLRRVITVGDLGERLAFYAGSRRQGLPHIRPLIAERRSDGWTPPESELEGPPALGTGSAPRPADRNPSGGNAVEVGMPGAGGRDAARSSVDRRSRRPSMACAGRRLRPGSMA